MHHRSHDQHRGGLPPGGSASMVHGMSASSGGGERSPVGGGLHPVGGLYPLPNPLDADPHQY